MSKAEDILKEMPSVKVGIDDFYGKQTVLNAINKALNLHSVRGSESSSIRFYKLECLTEDGSMETNGYYKTREEAELIKADLDKYKRNIKYGIKQQIVPIDLED